MGENVGIAAGHLPTSFLEAQLGERPRHLGVQVGGSPFNPYSDNRDDEMAVNRVSRFSSSGMF